MFPVHLDFSSNNSHVLTAASVRLDITVKRVTVFLAQLVSRNAQMYFDLQLLRLLLTDSNCFLDSKNGRNATQNFQFV